jgi:hypothetical protein
MKSVTEKIIEVDLKQACEIFVASEKVIEKQIASGEVVSRLIQRESGYVQVVKTTDLAKRFYLRTEPPSTVGVQGGVTSRDIWLALISGGIGGIAGGLSSEAIELLKFIVDAIAKNLHLALRSVSAFDHSVGAQLTQRFQSDPKGAISKGATVDDLILMHDTYLAASHRLAAPLPGTTKMLLDTGVTKQQFMLIALRKESK